MFYIFISIRDLITDFSSYIQADARDTNTWIFTITSPTRLPSYPELYITLSLRKTCLLVTFLSSAPKVKN
jgi:hypothetical protein